jgi:hypothetical protein
MSGRRGRALEREPRHPLPGAFGSTTYHSRIKTDRRTETM